MNINQVDCEILENLIMCGDLIYSLYFESDPKENIDILSAALDREKYLINLLHINKFKYQSIVNLFVDEAKNFPIVNLLIGTSPIIDKYNYPYFRILAHLKHRLNFCTDTTQFDHVLIDQEVKILYKLLTETVKIYPNLEKELIRESYMVLLDSPVVEKEILLNGFEPHKQIVLTYNEKRVEYLIHNIVKRLLYCLKLAKKDEGIIGSIEFQLSLNYLKTVILYLDPSKREQYTLDVIDVESERNDFKPIVSILKEKVYPIFQEVNNMDMPRLRLITNK